MSLCRKKHSRGEYSRLTECKTKKTSVSRGNERFLYSILFIKSAEHTVELQLSEQRSKLAELGELFVRAVGVVDHIEVILEIKAFSVNGFVSFSTRFEDLFEGASVYLQLLNERWDAWVDARAHLVVINDEICHFGVVFVFQMSLDKLEML